MEKDPSKSSPFLDRKDIITLLVIVTGALIIRSIALGSESFWIDEVMTARRSGWGFMEVMRSIGERDHLPLYYIVMMGWGRIFGTTEVGLRSFSVLAGGLSIIPIYLLGRRISWMYGILAGTLACVLPVQVYFGQEAKMYSLIILLSAVSFLFLLEYIDPKIFSSKKVSSIILLSANLLLVYTHYYGYLLIICELIFIFFIGIRGSGMSKWKQILRSLWPTMIPTLSGVFWFIFLLSEGFLFSQETGGGILLAPGSIFSIYPFLTGAYIVPDGVSYLPMVLASLILFICVIWGSVIRFKNGEFQKVDNRIIAIIFLVILPLTALFISLVLMNIFGHRYFLILAPVVFILAITPIKGEKPRKIRDGLLVSVIVLSLIALPVQYLNTEKYDWRGTVSYLNENMMDEDVLIPDPSWEWRSISYYDPEMIVIYSSNETDLDYKIADIERVWVVVKEYKDDGWVSDHIETVLGAPSIEKEFQGLTLYLFER